jgi:tetratricopeptide (TPR) repeat protein
MMKRIILFLSVVVMASSVFAQTSKQVNFSSLERKIEKSNSNLEHEKRSTRYKTWLSHGELMFDVYDAMTLSATTGMSISEFNIIVGTPKEETEKEIDGQMVTEYKMDRVNFYFINGVLEYWTFTDELVENPLRVAYDSFLKAKELDDRGRADKSLSENLNKLKYMYVTEGTSNYTKKNYLKSAEYFEIAVEIGEHPLVNYVDTVVIYYAGLSAQVGGDNEKAIRLYKKALEYNYGTDGNIYYNIFEAYSQLGKAEEGVEFLKEGFVKYPKNQAVLYGLINYYIAQGDDPQLVLEYIHQAMETDPNEPSLHFAEGTLHDKLDNTDKAMAAYIKAIELNPEFFDAQYNLAALYFNQGVKLLEEANKVPAREVDRYDEVMAKANAEFKKSIKPMEKAYELNPSSPEVVETLRNLYFRFRNEDESFQKKYEEMNEIHQSMKEQ